MRDKWRETLDKWREALDKWRETLDKWRETLDKWREALDQWREALDMCIFCVLVYRDTCMWEWVYIRFDKLPKNYRLVLSKANIP
jgi:hypothetical protein